MRSLLTILILALVCGGFSASGQIVYEMGGYSMGRTHLGTWVLRSGSLSFGFEQYRQFQDAHGNNLTAYSDVMAKGVLNPYYATVHCGWFSFDVRGPAWLTATLLALAVLLLLGLGTAGWSRLRKHRRPRS